MEQEEQWGIKDSDDDVPTILLNTSIAIFTAPPVQEMLVLIHMLWIMMTFLVVILTR
jgi:hypothetical protein